jgi:hypothetical protein
MWNVLVLVVLLSVGGYYATQSQERVIALDNAQAAQLADSMALYRQAVVAYFDAHPAQNGSVSMATLQSSNALPAWSTLSSQPAASMWANFRDTDGMIYIYAAKLPPHSIANDIVRLSQNSVLTGVFRTGDTTLHSPVFGDTGIKLPAPASVSIPNGSPVWIATRS